MRRMSLIPNWKNVLKKAWSVRLASVGAVLSAGELVANQYAPAGGKLAAAGAVCGAAAVVVRVLDQQINGTGGPQP